MKYKQLATLVFATALPNLSIAGDVMLHSLDPRDGAVTEVARGKMKHEPAFVVTPGDLFVIDVCGNAVGLMEDRYGDKTLGEPVVDANAALSALIAADHTGAWGIDNTGTLHQFAFNSYDSRQGSEVRTFNDEPIPEAKVFIHGDQEKPMFIDDRGNLVELRTSGTSIAELRRVGNVSGLSDVVAGVRTSFFRSGKLIPAVLLVKKDGSAVLLDLADDSTNLTSKGVKPFAGDFSGTALLFRGSEDDQTLIRVTDKGEIHRVHFAKQTQERISLPQKVHARAVGEDNRKLVYASTSGSFETCPTAALAEAAPEVKQMDDKGLFALLARLEEQAGKHKALFDEVENVADYSPGNVQTVEQYQQFYGPLAEKASQFNTTVGRMITQDRAALENDYRNEGGPARFLSELTNGERRDTSIPVSTLLSDYRDYLDDVATIAGRLEQTASTRNMVAEFQNNADDKVTAYKAARAFAQLALRFDEQRAEAHNIIRNTDQYVADALAAEQKALASNVWPAPFTHFDGPGNSVELEKAAYEYLHDKRGDETVLRVQLRGDWYAWQTNLVGEPLNYCLPIYIGMTDATYGDRGHVVEGEVCTRFNRMAPPFSVVGWSTNSYVIQKSRIQ